MTRNTPSRLYINMLADTSKTVPAARRVLTNPPLGLSSIRMARLKKPSKEPRNIVNIKVILL